MLSQFFSDPNCPPLLSRQEFVASEKKSTKQLNVDVAGNKESWSWSQGMWDDSMIFSDISISAEWEGGLDLDISQITTPT